MTRKPLCDLCLQEPRLIADTLCPYCRESEDYYANLTEEELRIDRELIDRYCEEKRNEYEKESTHEP